MVFATSKQPLRSIPGHCPENAKENKQGLSFSSCVVMAQLFT